METNRSKNNRGAILRSVVNRHPDTIVKIVKKAGYEKSSFYVHVKRHDLSFDILYKYGVAMDHDFSREIPEMEDYLSIHGPKQTSEKTLSNSELVKERDYWRDKYYALMEKYNSYVEETLNRSK